MFGYFRNNYSLSKDSQCNIFPHTHILNNNMSLTHCCLHVDTFFLPDG